MRMSPIVAGALACLALTSPALASAPASPLPRNVALLSDSKGVGILANTSVGEHLSPGVRGQMEALGKILHFFRDLEEKRRKKGEPEDPDAVLKRAKAFWAMEFAFAHKGLNGFTGQAPTSLRGRLETLAGHKVEGYNASVAAGSAETMPLQLNRMVEQLERRHRGSPQRLELFVVDIGAVDFIARTKPDDFAKAYLAGLDALVAHNPEARILAVKIPPITRLLEYPDRVAYRFLFTQEMCSSIRTRLGFMDAVVKDMDTDPVGTQERLARMNAFLDTLPAWFAAHHPHVKFALMEPLETDATLTGAAADCFHPNAEANVLLAEEALPRVLDLYAP